MLRNPSRLIRVPPVAPHANGGTYFGGRTASNTLAPVPTTVPVASSVPIAVLAWAPTHTGPSSRVPERTSAPLSSTTGPLRTSNTTPGSTTASCRAIALGSPSTVVPAGIGSASPSSTRRSVWSRRSRVAITSYTPRSTAPATSIVRACGWGRSHVAPGPTPQPTVMPPQVRRKAPSGSAGASPRGANVDGPTTKRPVTPDPQLHAR